MRATPIVAAALLLAACSSASEPTGSDVLIAVGGDQPLVPGQTVTRIGTIGFHSDPIVVTTPTTARVGEPLTVTVRTYGGGCVGEDSTSVLVVGKVAGVVPYQRVYTPRANEGCTLELRLTDRRATLTFAEAGVATIRVTGRVVPGDTLATVERRVRVQ